MRITIELVIHGEDSELPGQRKTVLESEAYENEAGTPTIQPEELQAFTEALCHTYRQCESLASFVLIVTGSGYLLTFFRHRRFFR